MNVAKENLEIRVLCTGKSYRVDRKEIGADVTRTVQRGSAHLCRAVATNLAKDARASGEFGNVRLMIEELF